MYLVKKSKARRARKNCARPSEPVVGSLPGSEESHSDQGWLSREMRVLDRYELQDDLVDTLRQTKRHSHLVARVAECHRSFRHKVCRCRSQWAKATKSCNCRLCPHDQRKRALRLAGRWEKVLLGRGDLRYLVLAERNSASLSDGLKSLYLAWSRLRKCELWKSLTVGSVAVLEVTYNREERTWHPHLNVLFAGSYIPQEAVKQAWLEATHQNGQTAFITKADAGTIRELIKYVTKLSDIVDQPAAVEEFLEATARKRFIRTYGEFYNLPVDEDEDSEHCPDCGSTEIADVGIVHASQIVIDENGVLRIDLNRLRPSQQPSTEDCHIEWPREPVSRHTDERAFIAWANRLLSRYEARA